MATTGYRTPFMGTVSANGTTAHNVYDLLSAVRTNLQHKACYLSIQLDASATGATLYIGDSDVAATMCGVTLLPTQAAQVFAFDSNLIVLDHVWLFTTSGEFRVNIIVVTR